MAHKANDQQAEVGQTGPTVQRRSKLPPASAVKLIKGDIIDISGASDFYKTRAEVATVLEDFVERRPDFRYLLKNGFDEYFLTNLSTFMLNPHLGPADALADALFLAGKHWASIDFGRLPIACIPEDEFLRDQWTGAADWDSFMIKDACIGEIWWHNLRQDGNVHRWKGGSDPGDFELRVAFGPETTQPPTMTIRVKGEPAAMLMQWWTTLTPNSPPQKPSANDALRKQTTTMLDSLLGALKIHLKLLRPERGRPRVDFGERAAHLLDHQKMNIAVIARDLCHLPADAGQLERRQCNDRIRKAANNYYKLLRSGYTELTDVRVRTRIIRLRGNPKSE